MGLPRLQAACRGVSRRELRELLARYRAYHEACATRPKAQREVLTWHVPGTVWAMDFTVVEAVIPVRKALVVRDLAAHLCLALEPARGELASGVVATLEALFRRHGPPLVLKADNGPGFVAEEVKDLCAHEGVALLYSPGYCPEFNGALEASNAWIKRDLAHLQRRQPATPAPELLAACRRQRNETGRPWGAAGPTPAERWAQRPVLGAAQRVDFYAEVEREKALARGESVRAALSHAAEAALGRRVIRRALVERDLLSIRRREVSL
ncbi:MAG: transposase family protein [Planctomycetota bacterium]